MCTCSSPRIPRSGTVGEVSGERGIVAAKPVVSTHPTPWSPPCPHSLTLHPHAPSPPSSSPQRGLPSTGDSLFRARPLLPPLPAPSSLDDPKSIVRNLLLLLGSRRCSALLRTATFPRRGSFRGGVGLGNVLLWTTPLARRGILRSRLRLRNGLLWTTALPRRGVLRGSVVLRDDFLGWAASLARRGIRGGADLGGGFHLGDGYD